MTPCLTLWIFPFQLRIIDGAQEFQSSHKSTINKFVLLCIHIYVYSTVRFTASVMEINKQAKPTIIYCNNLNMKMKFISIFS